MRFTASSYTGARAVTFTASGSSSIIKAGSQATLEAVAVHVGMQGGKGDKGDDGGSFTHTQTIATTSWIVNHNFGYRPAVQTLTMGGIEFLGEVLHVSANQAIVYFDSPSSGLAICS